MTDDLISRQAVEDIITSAMSGYLTDETRLTLEGIGITIAELPSAQKHGKWIYPSDIIGFGRCENCNALWDFELINNRFFRYCPRCGLPMRDEQQDHEKQQKEQEKNEWAEFWAKDPKAGEWWPTPSNETSC